MTRTNRKEGITRKVHKNGITLFGISYKSEALQQLTRGGGVVDAFIKRPIPDLRKIQVELSSGAILKLTAECLKACDEAVSEQEWLATLAEINAGRK
ncbi:Mu transposase C-terminal domain-containing protein [Rhizobium sp. S152]|uniref:Mu transposase C-terminal domain-containing protein n=1 Tax=Rhizobium sp. S152 TaxID=3055038 RepID=UPI0025AA26CC|nr:Mu transposase C-terminal domain-containing protein [Rhizobium sp. S152]MDM9627624.1 Mu transposase C-terminal domain-containing protein [Rhizobium sp. S152]